MYALIFLLAGCPTETNVGALTAEIAVAPTAVEFGEAPVLQTTTDIVYISNGGRAPLDVELTLEGDDTYSIDTFSATIAPDETLDLPVQFLPTTYVDYQATLRISSNDEDTSLVEVEITGTGGESPQPDIEIDPLSLDFGDVTAGGASSEIIMITNHGQDNLVLGDLVQTGSGSFSLPFDPSVQTLLPDGELAVVVMYSPSHTDGDNGQLTLPSNDPDEPELSVVLLGNGGGDFDYPVAVINCPNTSAPPEWVSLSAINSEDPLGSGLTYDWKLTKAPDGSEEQFNNTTSAAPSLFTDIAGEYTVSLTVTDVAGVSSAPDKCDIDAIPADEIHVELSWNTGGADIDLHLSQDDIELFSDPGDCNFCNPSPDWGESGSEDDPRLDLDDRSGYGPENINIEIPVEDTYQVRVHYFDEQGDDLVTATVRIYTYGLLQEELSQVMERDEVWEVGQINWPDGTVGVHSKSLDEAEERACW